MITVGIWRVGFDLQICISRLGKKEDLAVLHIWGVDVS